MISFPCPPCRKKLKVRPERSGRRVKCPNCQMAARVPAAVSHCLRLGMMFIMNERERLEREGLAAEVAFAAHLTDADRIRILRDLLRTADAIRKSKSAEELRREEEVRQSLDQPGRRRYLALCERLG